MVVVGLAPAAHGANRTGRPFTGDYAGDLLYRIDPRLYQSALNQARADLNSAIATSEAGRVRALSAAGEIDEAAVSDWLRTQVHFT